jgi:hypothetical protein
LEFKDYLRQLIAIVSWQLGSSRRMLIIQSPSLNPPQLAIHKPHRQVLFGPPEAEDSFDECDRPYQSNPISKTAD